MIPAFLSRDKNDLFAGSALIALFVSVAIFINPLREFPLNDDWVHTLTIKTFVDTGILFYPAFLAPSLYLPILYGIELVSLFDFSFSILRLTNLAYAAGTVLLLYHFLRKTNLSSSLSFTGALLLLFNPLFLNLSFTFMGDIPSLFLFLLSLYFFWNGLHDRRVERYALGVLFSIFAFSIRQIMVAPFLVATPFFLFSPYSKKWVVTLLFCAGALGVATLLVMPQLADFAPRIPTLFFLPQNALLPHLIQSAFIGITFIVLTGLTLFPIAGALAVKNFSSFQGAKFRLIPIGGFVGVATPLAYFAFINTQSIITLFGLGPSWHVFFSDFLPTWGAPPVYLAIIMLSLASIFFITHKAGALLKNLSLSLPSSLLVSTALIYSGGIIVFLPFFDRYYLPLVPLAIMGAVHLLARYHRSVGACVILLIILGTYSVIGTYNYLAWNEARWNLGQRMVISGIPAHRINGGYEWNGWHRYHDEIDPIIRSSPKEKNYLPQVNTLLYNDPEQPYRISLSAMKGYTVIDTEPVRGIGSQFVTIYGLKREGGAATVTDTLKKQ